VKLGEHHRYEVEDNGSRKGVEGDLVKGVEPCLLMRVSSRTLVDYVRTFKPGSML
jgi:hypothetical protein